MTRIGKVTPKYPIENVRVSWPEPRSAVFGPYEKEQEGLSLPQIIGACLVAVSVWLTLVCVLSLTRGV